MVVMKDTFHAFATIGTGTPETKKLLEDNIRFMKSVITNSAVYYIFDRDNESNFYSDAEYLSHTLKNSRDNGIETNGLSV